jgi:type VI secretion system protein ImpA
MSPVPEELEPLLQPISPEAPSGKNLRYEPIYDQIREARREDDTSLPQGVWQTTPKLANWGRVAELCQDTLTRESKDLQLAVWLTDAWLLQDGLRGLERGLRLTTALIDRFWDSVWPPLEEDDPEGRLAPLKWLDDRLPLSLARVPLVLPKTPKAVTLGDWQRILQSEKQSPTPPGEQEEPPAEAEGGPPRTREAFLKVASRIPAEALATSTEQAALALTAASELEQVLDARLGRTSAGVRRTRLALEELQVLLTQLSGQRPGASLPVAPGGDTASAPTVAMPTGRLRSRAEAYGLLALAADYLMSTEPHSPVPYLVKRAMAWGEMPLGTLLGELVPESSGLSSIHTLLGMKPSE